LGKGRRSPRKLLSAVVARLVEGTMRGPGFTRGAGLKAQLDITPVIVHWKGEAALFQNP